MPYEDLNENQLRELARKLSGSMGLIGDTYASQQDVFDVYRQQIGGLNEESIDAMRRMGMVHFGMDEASALLEYLDEIQDGSGGHQFEAFQLRNGLGWMGPGGDPTKWNENEDNYNEFYDRTLSPSWRVRYDPGTETFKSDFGKGEGDAFERLQQINAYLNSDIPQGPTTPGMKLARQDLNIAGKGAIVRRANNAGFQLRDKLGRFSSMVAKDRTELKQLITKMIVSNYKDREGLKVQSGTLVRSILDSDVQTDFTSEDTFSITVTPKEATRSARQNEPSGVSTYLYGPSLRYGHRPIVPIKQRYLRFKLGGHWIVTRNVRHTEAHEYMRLDDEQVHQVAEKLGQILVATMNS